MRGDVAGDVVFIAKPEPHELYTEVVHQCDIEIRELWTEGQRTPVATKVTGVKFAKILLYRCEMRDMHGHYSVLYMGKCDCGSTIVGLPSAPLYGANCMPHEIKGDAQKPCS